MQENDISYKEILNSITNLSEEYKRFIKSLILIIIVICTSATIMVCVVSCNYANICNNAVDAYLREDYGWPETNIEQNTNINTKE